MTEEEKAQAEAEAEARRKAQEQDGVTVETLKQQLSSIQNELDRANIELKEKEEAINRIGDNKNTILEEKRVLAEELKELRSTIGDRTAEQLKAAFDVSKDFEGKVSEKSEILARSRMKEFKESEHRPVVETLTKVQNENKQIKEQLRKALAGNEIRDEAQKYGVKPEAIEYVERDFEERIQVDENGKKFYVTKEGHKSDSKLNYEQEFRILKEKKPFLFNPNAGSTTGSPSNGVGEDVDNPWMTGNMTKQFMIESQNPGLAKSLKEKAGVA